MVLKWSGMAATASRQAGVYLGQLLGDAAAPWIRLLPASIRRAQAELLSATNTAVFEDIAWTHAAYLAPDGGLPALEEALAGSPSHRLLVDGFRKIDQGRALAGQDPERARELVWAGNRALLEHEQRHTVQPFFARFHPAFGALLSAMARADFRLGDPSIVQRRIPKFVCDMLRRGRGVLRATGAVWPDIVRLNHRWHWLDDRVLPCWREVDGSGQRALVARLEELAALTAR